VECCFTRGGDKQKRKPKKTRKDGRTERIPRPRGIATTGSPIRLGRAPVLFVVIGSDVAIMEALHQHDRQLFGVPRRLHLGPFNPAEVGELTGAQDPLEIFDGYSVSGGCPGLVIELSRHKSSAAFVKQGLSSPNTTLVTVAQPTLAAELADARPSAPRALSDRLERDRPCDVFPSLSQISDGCGATEQATSRALRHRVEAKRLLSVGLPVEARPKRRSSGATG
jgi:hypothetical protein